MKTHQEIFEIVARHLLTQRERSMMVPADLLDEEDPAPICAYRSAEGLKCGIGVLIPDSKYFPLMEEQSVSSMVSVVAGARAVFIEEGIDVDDATTVEFLLSLQCLHDGGARERSQPIGKDDLARHWAHLLHDAARQWHLSSGFITAEFGL